MLFAACFQLCCILHKPALRALTCKTLAKSLMKGRMSFHAVRQNQDFCIAYDRVNAFLHQLTPVQ